MRKLSRVAFGATLSAVVLTAGVSGTATAVAGAPLECGDRITKDTRLTADLVDCPGPGLVIAADGLTVDLAGHTVDGTGAGPGIDNSAGHDALAVRNGTVSGFAQGMDLTRADDSRVRDITVEDNLVGVVVLDSDDVVVRSLTARDNNIGAEAFGTDDLLVRASVFSGGGHGGLVDRATSRSHFIGNVFNRNEFFGLLVDSSSRTVVTGNAAVGNAGDGFQLGFWTRTARLEGNRAVDNGAHGFSISDPGNRLRANTAVGNGGVGIAAVEGTVDLGRNRAAGNGQADCVAVSCR